MVPTFFLLAISNFLSPLPQVHQARLGSSNWVTREFGSLSLRATLRTKSETNTHLVLVLQDSQDPEVVSRLHSAINIAAADRYRDALFIVNTRWDDFPCIDGLWYDSERKSYATDCVYWYVCARMGTSYLTRPIEEYPDPYGRPWYRWRMATRLWVLDQILLGVPPERLDAVLLEMHRADRTYCEQKNVAWRSSPDVQRVVGGEIPSIPQLPKY